MATPAEVTIRTLNGTFVMNKTLSDNPDQLLALQGVSWLTRKAIGFTTVVLSIKTYQDSASTYHVDIFSNASNVSKSQENRTLDWVDRDHTDKVFGLVRGRSRLFNKGSFESARDDVKDAEDVAFLQGGQLKNGTASPFLEEESLQSFVKNQDAGYGWTAEQVWNFEEIQGKRYHTRRIVCRDAQGQKVERIRLVYDYKGSTKDETSKSVEDDDGLAYGDD